MNDDAGAGSSAMFILISVIYFVILGWFLKIGLWICRKGWHAAATELNLVKGFVLMLIGVTEITFMIYVFWVGYKTKYGYLGDLQPAIEAYYLHWLAGSLILAIMIVMFSQTKRVQKIADEVRASI